MVQQRITIKLPASKPRNKDLNDILRSKRGGAMAPVKDPLRLSERKDILTALRKLHHD